MCKKGSGNLKAVLFLEDDKDQRNYLVDIARRYDADLTIHQTDFVSTAMYMAMNNEIHAFFIDVVLPDGNGIDFARKIRSFEQYQFTPIIFITGNIQRELEAFREVHCYDFITKPYHEKVVEETLQKILVDYLGMEKRDAENKFFDLEFKSQTHRINIKDIIYFERMNRKIFIKTLYEEIMYKQTSLSQILEQFPAQFIQIHQSIIVNLNYVERIDFKANELHLKNGGAPLPVGTSFRKKVGEQFSDIR